MGHSQFWVSRLKQKRVPANVPAVHLKMFSDALNVTNSPPLIGGFLHSMTSCCAHQLPTVTLRRITSHHRQRT